MLPKRACSSKHHCIGYLTQRQPFGARAWNHEQWVWRWTGNFRKQICAYAQNNLRQQLSSTTQIYTSASADVSVTGVLIAHNSNSHGVVKGTQVRFHIVQMYAMRYSLLWLLFFYGAIRLPHKNRPPNLWRVKQARKLGSSIFVMNFFFHG